MNSKQAPRRQVLPTHGRWEQCTAVVAAVLLLAQPAALATGSQRSSVINSDGHARGIVITPVCPGDCNGDEMVSIDELITGVNMALGQSPPEACSAFDVNFDAEVTVDEIITALTRSLLGCAAQPDDLSLSARALAPGEMLTIFHPSIIAGRAVTVTFRGPDRYVLTVSTDLTENGAARIAVPPFIDTTSFRFTSGEVAVSIGGVDSEQSLVIEELPQVQAVPGDLTVALLDFGIDSLAGALDGLDALAAETGVDQSHLAAALENRIDVMADMADEIDNFGRLTLGTPSGPVVLRAENLVLLDRLVAASVVGAVTQAGGAATGAGAAAVCSTLLTREGWADCLEQTKRVGISGVQVIGSYVSVFTGLVALAAVPVPILEPLAGVGAAFAVGSTFVVTAGSALVSFFADLSIDAIRQQDPDFYRAARNAEDVLISGVRSIGLTFAGGVQWAGATLGTLVGFGNDSKDGINSVRDLSCASSEERRLLLAPASKQEFCRLTQNGGVPSPTATRTVPPTPTRPIPTATRVPTASPTVSAAATRTPTTATRTPPPSTTPTRSPTPTASAPAPTATRTSTRSPSPTPTRTPMAQIFTVSFYQNTDGATGTSAASAQIQLSGATDFPTIAWAGSVGDVLQVTVLTNPTGLLYGINASTDDNDQLIPIRSPLRYGDYSIANTVRLVTSAAPPLVPGTDYAVNVLPVDFRGHTASIVFHVTRR